MDIQFCCTMQKTSGSIQLMNAFLKAEIIQGTVCIFLKSLNPCRILLFSINDIQYKPCFREQKCQISYLFLYHKIPLFVMYSISYFYRHIYTFSINLIFFSLSILPSCVSENKSCSHTINHSPFTITIEHTKT